MLFILVSLEIISRLNVEGQFLNFNQFKNEDIKKNSHPKHSPENLLKEYGPISHTLIPAQYHSHYDLKKLKEFTYSDIDHNNNPDRFWSVSDETQNRSSQFSKKIKNTDIELYNVTYTLNKYSKRFVESQDHKQTANKFIIASGDSFTFGEGINQGYDYPSQLAAILPDDWKVYNYGIAGDGVNDFYLRVLANPNYFEQIKEASGDFIWLFHEVQFKRLVFPLNAYKTDDYILSKPEYTLSEDLLTYHGLFNSSSRPLRKVLNLAGHFQIPNTFNMEIPRLFTENNFKLFFNLLNNSIQTFEKRGKKVNRRILINYYSQINLSQFSKIAQSFGFEVFDVEKLISARDLENGGDVQMKIPVDGHPSSEAYWLLSQALKHRFY